MGIDLQAVRQETPGVGNVIHFNNAGSALPPDRVVRAMVDHLWLEAALGGYEAQDRNRARIERPYAALARLLNCDVEEISLQENATRAWDMAFYSLRLKAGDRVLTGRSEYCSNFVAFLHVAQRTGVEISVVPNDEWGQVSVAALAELIDERVKLIAVTHVPTSGGLVNPVADIGRVARRAGVPFLLDACQSVGQMSIDVRDIGCDFLSGTGRKFLRGPRGTGFLYVRRDLIERLDPPFLDDHAANWVAVDRYCVRRDARKFETQECSFAGRIGLGVAVDYALELTVPAIEARVTALAAMAREFLGGIDRVRLHDTGRDLCGIVTFSVDGVPASAVQQHLAGQAINTSVSVTEATRLDLEPRGLDAIVRASVHYYNTEQEIMRFIDVVSDILHARWPSSNN